MKNFWNFWKCKKCQKTFRKPYQLRNYAAIHISGLSFSCSYCDERFTTKMRLSKHKRIKHRNIMKKNSENSQCEQSEFQKQKLREVEELLMEVNGVWKCKECNKTASEKNVLSGNTQRCTSVVLSSLVIIAAKYFPPGIVWRITNLPVTGERNTET